MKETFKLTDDDFKEYADDIGFDQVDLSDHPVQLAQAHIDALERRVGELEAQLHECKGTKMFEEEKHADL